MKTLFFAIACLSMMSCAKLDSVLDKTESMPAKMDDISAKTEELKRLTIVGEMKKELEDTKNYKKSSPIYYDLMTPANKIAENFTVDEALKWIDLRLNDVINARYDDNNDGRTADVSNVEAVEYDKNKLGLFNAVCAVAGFLPETTIDKMISKINTSEEYSSTALKIFAMRAYFIQNVLMKEKYAAAKLETIGSVEAAIGYNQSLEKVIKLPFVNEIKIQMGGFTVHPEYNDMLSFGLQYDSCDEVQNPASCTLNKGSSLQNWKSISRAMDLYLKVTQFSANTQDSRVKAAREIVNTGLNTVLF